jgi:hypothetical protein
MVPFSTFFLRQASVKRGKKRKGSLRFKKALTSGKRMLNVEEE